MQKQNIYGRAFEYATIDAISRAFSATILQNDVYLHARDNYLSLGKCQRHDMDLAAVAGVKMLLQLEPLYLEDESVTAWIQPDSCGVKGDVRDVLIQTSSNRIIGVSCKHNHEAMKHSRLSASIDFGKEWMGYPCSNEYFNRITPIFDQLSKLREDGVYWNELGTEKEQIYIAILEAFQYEMDMIIKNHIDAAAKLVHYLIGTHDFYKIISEDKYRMTSLQAYNMSGTLNVNGGTLKSVTAIPTTPLPERVISFKMKEESETTLELVCDKGWQISFRIHNAKKQVEPSLKFDIQLISGPTKIYKQVNPWYDREKVYLEYVKKLYEIFKD